MGQFLILMRTCFQLPMYIYTYQGAA
ncbi:hypothetical protein OIU84_025641, partial [Salix udensis]